MISSSRPWARFACRDVRARLVLHAVAVCTLLLASTACDSGSGRAARNVVLITLDTTRADALSIAGGPEGASPVLDALAARSTFFTHAYSDSNVTNPSHVSILSGRHALDHGVVSNFAALPGDVDTIVETAQSAGWDTAAFVSRRHLGPELGWQGFATFPAMPEFRDADETTGLALDWLASRETDRPFFLWLHYWEPHMPYQPAPELATRFYSGDRSAGPGPPLADLPFFQVKRWASTRAWLGDTRDPAWAPAMYAAEVHTVDLQIERLLAAIARANERETLIVVTADHGENLGEHGIYYSHAGLYEQTLRVPLIIHAPGAPARRSDARVSTLDIAPTLAELAGIPFATAGLPGRSLAPIVLGEAEASDEDRVLIHQNAHNHGVAVRSGRWKLIQGITPGHDVLRTQPQLFDLEADPAEAFDRAAEHPEVVAELQAMIEPWRQVGTVRVGDAPRLDAEILEQLEALGYGRAE